MIAKPAFFKTNNRFKSLIEFLKTPKGTALFLVLVAVGFNAIVLWPEVRVPAINVNDEVYHFAATQEASVALGRGQDPTDFWFSSVELGYPLFHHYQHLPQLVLVIINRLTSSFLSLARLFDISRYLLLVFWPAAIFLAMRWLEFDFLAAGISALASSLISTNGLFGLEYGSYVWRGFGLYPQLWAMFFLPLALAALYRVATKKGSLFWAVVLSAIVLLSQVFYGYFLLVAALVFVFLKPTKKEICKRAKRLVLTFLLVGVITSYFWIPLFLDIEYTNRSQWIPLWKYDSFGARKILVNLLKGDLLDWQRLPCLTFAFIIGLIFLIGERKKDGSRILLCLLAVSLVLFFGRPTWGGLLKFLPFSHFLQLHRFIGGVHLAAVMIIGAGGFLAWKKISQRSGRRYWVLAIIVFLVIFGPAWVERARFCQENKLWRQENKNAFIEAQPELEDIGQTFKELGPGRVFAGLPATWGNYPYYQIGSVPLYAIFAQWGLDSFGYSYHSEALTADVRLHFDDTRPSQYNLFNIRYVLLHKTWSPPFFYYPVQEFSNYVLYQVPTTGYFDLVDADAVFWGPASEFYHPNFQWLLSSLPELKQHPILELGEMPKQTFGLPTFAFSAVDSEVLGKLAQDKPDRGQILGEDIGSQRWGVRFVAEREAYLMLKTNYHPGLQAELDGRQIRPLMLAPGFLGIKVEPGTHEALFWYKLPSWRLPLLGFGILVLAGLFFEERRPFVQGIMRKIIDARKIFAKKDESH